jgi:hypothetical protein
MPMTNKVKGGSLLSEQDVAALKSQPAGTIGHVAALEVERLRQELATPPDERSELHWTRGYSAGLTGLLSEICRNLGYDGAHAQDVKRVAWISERERTITALRAVCRDIGDNDWPDDLYLPDVIEKHLHRHFDAGRVGTIQRLLKSLTSDEARKEALSEVCEFCGSIHLPCYCTRDE